MKKTLKRLLYVICFTVISVSVFFYASNNAEWQTATTDTQTDSPDFSQNPPEILPEKTESAQKTLDALRENTKLYDSGYVLSEGVFASENFALAISPAKNPETFSVGAKYFFDTTLDDGTVLNYYDYYLRPHMGYITFSDGNTTRIFDKNSNEIIIPQEYALSFAKTRDKNGNPVLVDRVTGKYYIFSEQNEILESDYDKVRDFRGVFADYSSDYGVSDTEHFEISRSNRGFGFKMDGEDEVISIYKKAFNYSEGFGCTYDAQNRLYFFNNEGRLRIGGLAEIMYGAGDVTDERALGYYYFDEGLTRITKKTFSKGKLISSRETFVDRKGDEFKTPADYTIYSYSNGRILLTKDGLWGFMNSRGKWILNPKYSFARPFFEGLAVVGTEGGKKGVIDRDGNFVIPQVFDEITDCSGGIICAYEKETGWHIIHKVEYIPQKAEEITQE